MSVDFTNVDAVSSRLFITGADHDGWKYLGRPLHHYRFSEKKNSEGHSLPMTRGSDWIVAAIHHLFALVIYHDHRAQAQFTHDMTLFLGLGIGSTNALNQKQKARLQETIEERGPFLLANGQLNPRWLATKSRVMLKKARFEKTGSQAMGLGSQHISIHYAIDGTPHVILYYFEPSTAPNVDEPFIVEPNGAPNGGCILETMDAGEHGDVLYISNYVNTTPSQWVNRPGGDD